MLPLSLFVCFIFLVFFKLEIAEGKLLTIFLCNKKKQFCKQFYRTGNFKYASTSLPITQYLLIWFQISLYFPVRHESAAPYLSQKDTLEKNVLQSLQHSPDFYGLMYAFQDSLLTLKQSQKLLL